MNLFSTLRTRLLTTYLGLLLLGFGGLTLFAGRQIENSIYTNFINNQKVQALRIASDIGARFSEESEDGIHPNQQGLILQAYRYADEEVMWLDKHGIVTASSDDTNIGADFSKALDLTQTVTDERAESVSQAELAAAKSSNTIFAAAPLQGEYLAGYIRLASPTETLRGTVQRQWMILGATFILFSTLGTLISLWLLSTLTKPLSELRDTALNMASGDLDQRVVIKNRDEIGAVGSAFNEMATQVQAMVLEQKAFAANASHELRTPLTTIRLRTEALQSGQLDEERSQQYINEIEHEVQRMGSLVGDLILLSRLDAQQLDIGQEEVQIERVAQFVVKELINVADAKQIQINVVQPPKRLPTVMTNTSHAQVIIRNLVDNAIKYTPLGGTIELAVTKSEQKIKLQVRDNGQGISPSELPRVTERFYRADKAHSRDVDGVGLGLPLVKSIVDMYGGDFQIESKGAGEGTTVSVWLPISSGE